MIDFHKLKTTREDVTLIAQIAKRAADLLPSSKLLDIAMDIEVAHWKRPLYLRNLLAARDADFAHDVTGIACNLDRETGDLKNCFVPRYAMRRPSAPKPGKRWPLLREA